MKSLAVLACLVALGCDARPVRAPLDSARAGYIEDEPGGRTLAAVEAALVRAGDGARLEVQLSAEGPEIEPVPGFAGVRGSNRITARELTRLVDDQRATVLTRSRSRDARSETLGDLRVLRTGSVAERRLRPDGVLELEARTREEFVLELGLSSGTLPPGRWRTEVLVGDTPRLAIDFSFDGRAGRIERIDSHPAPVAEELGP